MKRKGTGKTASPAKHTKQSDASTQHQGMYNAYIHGTTSAAFAMMIKDGDFALKSPALMATEGKAPVTGEINQGGLVGNQFMGCNPCFGQIQNDGSYGLDKVVSYALEKHGSTFATSPDLDLNKQLSKPNHGYGLVDINLLNIYLLRCKQMGIEPKIGTYPCGNDNISLEQHFDLNLQLHYFYLGLGKALSPNMELYEAIEDAKLQETFFALVKRVLSPDSFKSIILKSGLDLNGIWQEGNTLDASPLLSLIDQAFNNELALRLQDSLESDDWAVFGQTHEDFKQLNELMNGMMSQSLFKLGRHGYDTAWRDVELIYVPEGSEVDGSQYVKDQDNESRPRFYVLISNNQLITYDVCLRQSVQQNGVNTRGLVAKYNLDSYVQDGVAHLKDVGIDMIKSASLDNDLVEAREYIEQSEKAFVGDMGQIVRMIFVNYIGLNELAMKQQAHLVGLDVLKSKYQTFMNVLHAEPEQFRLTEEQMSLQTDTVPVIFVLEDPTIVEPCFDEGEYRSIEPRVGIGRNEPIKMIASDTLAHAHRLGKFLNEKGVHCQMATFDQLDEAPLIGPKSKLTHRDGLPRLAWLATRALEQSRGADIRSSKDLNKLLTATDKSQLPKSFI